MELWRYIKLNPTNIASLFQKATQKVENSQFIEQNFLISFWPSLFLLRLVLPSPSPTVEFFHFLDTVLFGWL